MSTIYTPEETARILVAVQGLLLSNNGHTDIGLDAVVAQGLDAAGFVVVAARDLHGKPTMRAFTPKAWAIHAAEAIEAYRNKLAGLLEPHERTDFEARILARNADHLLG